MFRFSLSLLVALAATLPGSAAPTLEGKKTPLPAMVSGLKNPESVCIGPDGRIYVTQIGEFDQDGDGSVVAIVAGKIVPFADNLNDPKGIVVANGMFFVADKKRVLKIDAKGKVSTFAEGKAFPVEPLFLNDIEADQYGTLYVTDSGDLKGSGGKIFRIDGKTGKVTLLLDDKKEPALKAPNGLRQAGEGHLFLLDFASGVLSRLRLADKSLTKIADGFDGGDGLAHDHFGRLYLTSWKSGKVWVMPRPGVKPILLASGFTQAADICLSKDGKSILVPDMKVGTLTAVPCTVPGMEVDESSLAVKTEPAFADIEWTGWKGETDSGKIVPHRPIVLTHAGDGSNRTFVATQHGVVHILPKGDSKKTKIFLDIQDRVIYKDEQNEEGFLGLAFHPDFKKNGEFFVYYTPKNKKLTNVVSRFKRSKDDPDTADPASEEILLELKKPFWNHNGGTIEFGPDKKLYIAIGDGGAANDPFGHAQNMNSLLGKILRIDVDTKDEGKAYAIPKDNPFVGKDKVRGEIWASGLRNVWRMSFDRKTGRLWAADVGQNLWEEINLIDKGGNYGWNPRESLHAFGPKGIDENDKMIEPIWEYHHDIGKSITGGNVYRGSKVKALEGLYLYADYVSGHVWALRYDEDKKRVTGNHLLREGGSPIFSFGEDEAREVYMLTSTPTGKGIWRFAAK